MSCAYLICGGNSLSRQKKLQEIYQESRADAEPKNDLDTSILENQNSLKIEDIRELERILSLKPYTQPPKIAIIKEAEKLTFEAQGALLKILEEPPGETVFILTTQDDANLLPTIISRCQQITLPQEAEITLKKEEKEKIKDLTQKVMQANLGQRIKIAEEFATKDVAMLFCQKQMVFWRESFLGAPDLQTANLLRILQKTLKYLNANVNPKLALENLLLSYPQAS